MIFIDIQEYLLVSVLDTMRCCEQAPFVFL